MEKTLTDEQLDTMVWWQEFQDTNNKAFYKLMFDKHRYLILKGGGGSGKSIFAGRKILERASSQPGHRMLVVRKVAKTLRESCFEQLKAQAYQYYADKVDYIPKGKGSDLYIRMKNGSEIIFAGLDDVEKLKSIYDITGIWIEEASEIEEADFNQLDIRLRTETPYYLQMILSFNPISITHWLKKRFFDQQDPRAMISETTYKDNRFLTPEAVETLENFKDTDEYYYQVYCLGEWGVTGRTVFDAKAVTLRLVEARKETPKKGLFDITLAADEVRIESWKWTEDHTGPVTVWKEPVSGRPYVIGVDTAGDGSDWFVGHVLDNATGEQVAVARCQYDEDTFTRQLFCLGRWYNDALIGIECNFSTYPAKLLAMMGYKKQYVREAEDTYTGAIRKSYGVRTDRNTRQVMIADLVRIMREHVEYVHHPETLEEMLTFVRNEKLRPEAEPGAHDDCVMALAISYYIRPQQTAIIKAPEEPSRIWTPDMWEDWHRASKKEREYLIKKWGKPKK